jgi:hypothetical protein
MTDPESRIMKTQKGFVQGYNAQLAVDDKNQIIVACDLTNEENDTQQLGNMLDQCEKQSGQLPEISLLDAGYWQKKNVEQYQKKTQLYVATRKSWKLKKELKEKGAPRGRKPNNLNLKEEMERKLLTKKGRKIYKVRGKTVEPVIGQIKTRGLRSFSMRRQEKSKGEWALWCLTHNLIKLWRNRLKNVKK